MCVFLLYWWYNLVILYISFNNTPIKFKFSKKKIRPVQQICRRVKVFSVYFLVVSIAQQFFCQEKRNTTKTFFSEVTHVHYVVMCYIFHLNCLSQSASRLRRHMTTQYETIYVSVIGHVKVKVSSMAMKLTPQLFNTLLTNFSQPWNSVYLPFQNF